MAIISLPIGFWIDTATAAFDTGTPTFDATTDWHGDVELVDLAGHTRAEVAASTADFLVEKMAAGAWQFPVTINFRPSSQAQSDVWNAAVAAGTAVSYKFLQDRNNVASATNLQVEGQFLPNGLLLNASAHGGIVEKSVTLTPSGTEPYIKVTTSAAVYYGKLN